MKKSVFSLVAALALVASMSSTLSSEAFASDSVQGSSIQFSVTEAPSFPQELMEKGHSTGLATVRVMVDEHGFLEDWIVLEASDVSLVNSIAEVIYGWEFVSARVGGHAVRSVGDIVVQLDAGKAYQRMRRDREDLLESSFVKVYTRQGEMRRTRARPQRVNYVVARQLDSSPQLVAYREPAIGRELYGESDYISVRMEYYVDAEGRVRMPAPAERGEDVADEAVYALQHAMRSWRFAPLTVNKEPATLRLVQTIRIKKPL
ncbi:hypothetical protein QEH56_01530 [Pelagicoccus enzymogenes]|uniref:energy transducer TonB n=1 Tax=Pelagicoccus enzymogenes TaxID=2773457 RepID=UPI00280EB035|nr:hypothetical protein [Pelagicoccus enzymogenes]MDQ8196805.1 hypothetical protein [Pelagicoccus enzymogenes]